VVAPSVMVMDGGPTDETGAGGRDGADGGDEIFRLVAARRAQAAADARALASAPYVCEALERLRAAIDDLQAVRWPAVGAEQMAAAVRVLYAQHSRLDAAVLAAVRALDDRDDVVPRARPKTAGARFLHHALGLDRRVAARHAITASLLFADAGDLSAVGHAYADGLITRGHVDIAATVHHRLHASVRDQLIPVVDPATGEQGERRCIAVVDAVLARQSQVVSVPELKQIADRLIEHLDPPTPDGAHERRYLHLSPLPDGSLVGKFACGPAQALAFQAVIAAAAAPQPGSAIDPDGTEHVLPDERTSAQRRMDALVDALNAAASGCGAGGTQTVGKPTDELLGATGVTDSDVQGQPDPPREGEEEIRGYPGVRRGPYPPAEIIVAATLDQLATALRLQRGAAGGDPPGPFPDPGPPDRTSVHDLHDTPGFARAQHGGPVHPDTLALLACSARLRAVIADPHGAVLHLGRASRLATPAQRRALLARDGGCVIPGCAVPGEHCDVHHPTPWASGGTTDIRNLAMVCPRHHSEIHEPGGWQIEMVHDVPWVRPPSWVQRDRPLRRNTTHGPRTGIR